MREITNKYGIKKDDNIPFTIEKCYEKASYTAIKTPEGKRTINQIYEKYDGLLHITDRVRIRETGMELYQDCLFIHPCMEDKIEGLYKYPYEELSEEKELKDLFQVFYKIQPRLQTRTLMCSNDDIAKDPNHYFGAYILNNNKEYNITKQLDTVKITRIENDNERTVIYNDKINFDLYKISLEYDSLRHSIIFNIRTILDTKTDTINEYVKVKEKLDMLLEDFCKN